MMTEGLVIVTNDGHYARSLELPANQLWRTYRVRVHGRLTLGKLNAMRKGVTVKMDDDVKDKTASGEVVQATGKTMKYKGIKVSIERKTIANRRKRGGGQAYSGGTNTWIQITCTEGKNRMLRRILSSMGLDVTRLIRISYGDYDLNTIPPGMAVEVPVKLLDKMKKKGPMFASERNEAGGRKEKKLDDIANAASNNQINAVQWVSYS
jgi:23S rRNA pseudouridine2605 synthase